MEQLTIDTSTVVYVGVGRLPTETSQSSEFAI